MHFVKDASFHIQQTRGKENDKLNVGIRPFVFNFVLYKVKIWKLNTIFEM